jgi:hypothetical protein
MVASTVEKGQKIAFLRQKENAKLDVSEYIPSPFQFWETTPFPTLPSIRFWRMPAVHHIRGRI